MFRSRNTNQLRSIALLALVLTSGLQLWRVFFPSVAWYLKDSIGSETTALALYVAVVMNVGFLAAISNKALGRPFMLWVTAGGLALARFIEQMVKAPPMDLWISMLGCGLFALFLPTYIAHLRVKENRLAGSSWAFGLILGLSLDSAIRGLTGTLDLSWIPGSLPILGIALMSVAILLLLREETQPATNLNTETGWRENMAFTSLGPYLVLQLIVFQNQGWVSEISGLSSDWAFLLVMSGNSLAMVGVIAGYKHQILYKPIRPIIIALLIVVISFGLEHPEGLFIFATLVVQTLFGWSWAEMGTRSFSASRKGLGRTTTLCTLGLLLFILLAFIYYASLDIPLPFSRHTIFPTAGILYGAFYLGLVLRRPIMKVSKRTITPPLFTSGILSLVPIFILVINSHTPNNVEPTGKSFKIMTYNIHSAYNIEGRQDPEAIARVIEESNADIIAFQEISRGWLVNGSTDLVSWLAKRLDMQALFKGTTGPMWGNAVLSRFPILSHSSGALPALDTPLERGYLWAIIDVGAYQPLNLIATHLHHLDEDSLVRLAQVNELIRVWDGKNQTILLGDLNARPDDAELKPIHNAGFIDAWYIAGQGEGFTYSSEDPFKRIDWIWHTPDLTTQDINVLSTTASDHLPVIATIHPVP